MHINLADAHWAFLPTQPAGRREIRFALAAVLVSVLIFLVAVPFARTPLVQVPAFVPMYVASLVICDLITAALLFGQYRVLRSTALLVLAGAYLFTASITFAYALIFPGLFSLPGLPLAGAQTSSAMYMFWHSGFPLIVIAYTRFKPDGLAAATQAQEPQGSVRLRVLATMAAVFAVVIAYTLCATWGRDYIPVFLDGDRTTVVGHVALAIVWTLSLVALLTVWRRKPHTVLDMWLLVVMCVWLCDIALAAILNTGRYDLGWYVGRIYGLLSASFLLIVLLFENARHYAQLVQMSVELSSANKALAQLSRQDGLTGLANRRCFDDILSHEWRRAQRSGTPLALAMFDVDFFKPFNDRYGHVAGDECLRNVARVLQQHAGRASDCVARYGGEEFAIIYPVTDRDKALLLAESMRAELEQLKLPHVVSPFGHVTVSVGVNALVPVEGQSAQTLIESADKALYMAKEQGRNQVVVAEACLLV
jgi:diguanylate cyclase (GGDEF)-like protein